MDLDKQKKNRTALKTVTTKLFTKIDSTVKTDNVDQLEILLEQLEEKYTNLKIVNKEILILIDPKEVENEIERSEEYYEQIIAYKHKINKKLKELKSSNAKTETISSSSANSDVKKENSIKLPKLSVNKFYGDSSQWLEFFSQFENAIDKNENLSKVDKLIYLKNFLGGSAAKTISGLSLKDDNYQAALDLLKNRFGQTNLLINTHLGSLLNIQSVKNSNDIFGLRKLLDSAETEIRNLESLGIDPKTYANLLTPILLKTIPHELTLEFSRKNTGENWDLEALLNFLREEISARERSMSVIAQFDKRKNSHTVETRSPRSTPRVASAHQLSVSVKKCLFCKSENHDSEKCIILSIQQKRELLKKEGRCYLCLQTAHRISECTKKIRCGHCKGKHSLALCYKIHQIKENNDNINVNSTDVITAVSPCGSHKNEEIGILLQTACVNISHNGYYDNARILLDCGSMRSFISVEKSRKLHLPIIRREKLSVFSFGDKKPLEKLFNVVKVKLENKHDSNLNLELELLEIENISTAHIPPLNSNLLNKNKHLKRLHLADYNAGNKTEPISILIGADFYFLAVTGRIEKINRDLVASETLFGWCLLGKNDPYPNDILSMKIIVRENDISNQIKKFWELESLGITSENEQIDPLACDVMKTFESEIKFENSRYKVRLPWKSDKKHLLNDNKNVAEMRFSRLKKQFRNNPDLFVQYQSVLQDYLKQNIIEPVPDYYNDQDQITFYLPHRAVIRDDRCSTKLRIVFDASSHDVNEISLNDCLHVGPNLYPDVLDILLRFRLKPIAFTADLKQAFLQIVVDERDRDVSRFLFSDNPGDDSSPSNCYRFTRVLFGLNSSPFLLAATIKHHLRLYENVYPETYDFLNDNVYVDDIIGGNQDAEHAFRTSLECVRIFKDGGMQVHKWQTNSRQLEKMWVREGIVSKESLEVFETSALPVKVLGIGWDKRDDSLYFDVGNLLTFLSKRCDTKRFLLQAVGRIFDPAGFLSPFVLRVKFMIQEIWQLALEWDEKLPNNLITEWHKWCDEISNISNLKIPRYYLSDSNEDDPVKHFELHFFSDASQKAFGTVVYLRILFASGYIRTVFVASKTRVAPLKSLTLPRLELMAALLSAKLSSRVIRALKLNATCYYWVDSTIALFWIKGTAKEFKPFVENRVEEIRKLTEPSDWYYCPGIENPADLASRGANVSELRDNSTWFEGPKWLSMTSKSWPTQEKVTITDPDIAEYRKKTSNIHQNLCTLSEDKLLDMSRYSSLLRLLRVTAWIMRFIHNSRNTVRRNGTLNSEELLLAEEFWVRYTQREFYDSEIRDLIMKRKIKSTSSIVKLAPFLDHKGILRLKGRLEESEFTMDEKQPILLPHNSEFTKLLVRREHANVMHCGVSTTLVQIRKKYWIPKGRQFVKRVINDCLVCRRFSARPAAQMTGQLPKDRIVEGPPFSVTGVDFTGPVFVKLGKEIQKSYITLFTCAITRAVHLELVSDMSSQKFILALRRFISRRGNCKVFYSDNAKTFKCASKDIQAFNDIMRKNELQNFLSSEGITWKFMVEMAPWWGGFYERLMRSIKEPLKKILGRAQLSFEEIMTVLAEIENVLNQRPLTYVCNELTEPESLSPAHFLFAGQKKEYPFNFAEILIPDSTKVTKDLLLRRKRYQTRLLSQLWTKWRREYMLNLRNFHYFGTPDAKRELSVDDVVLVQGNQKSKFLWNLGRITEVFKGRDGLVRSCVVKTKNGLFKRPIQLLYPLELNN